MQISVTQQDIDEGERVNCYSCPVALALKRHTGKRWGVSGSFATVCVGDVVQAVNLPEVVSYFVRAFDGCYEVPPFTFELDWEST